RGPATAHDFAWWSGLTVADARTGVEMVGDALNREDINGKTYWFSDPPPRSKPEHAAHLLSPYDEFLISYRDRGRALHPSLAAQGMRAQCHSAIVGGGQMVATWRRTLPRRTVTIPLAPFTRLCRSDRDAIVRAARKYGTFVDRAAIVIEDQPFDS